MSERDEVREHSFDGIQEYDNDLPRWWLWLFVLTVVFAAVYPFYYDFGPGEFASESIDKDVAAWREARQAPAEDADESNLLVRIQDAAAASRGKEIFATRCMPCHGDKGQGLIGPNLTDDHWLHGGSPKEIRAVVTNGVLEKGMIAWKDQLSADQITDVVAFVWSLYGTEPPNPKAPQGEKVIRQQ